MTRDDRIRAAIWTPVWSVLALTAMYWDGTDTMTWAGLIMCGLALAVCGVADWIVSD